MNKDYYADLEARARIKYLEGVKETATSKAASLQRGSEVFRTYIYGEAITSGFIAYENTGYWRPFDGGSTSSSKELCGDMTLSEVGSTTSSYLTVSSDLTIEEVFFTNGASNFETGVDPDSGPVEVSTLLTSFSDDLVSSQAEFDVETHVIESGSDTTRELNYTPSTLPWKSQIILIAAHEIENISKIIINGQELSISNTTGAVDSQTNQYCFRHYGVSGQKADYVASVFNAMDWGKKLTFDNIAYVHLLYSHDSALNTADSIQFKVRGKKVYSTPTTVAYSDNPIRCLYDYLIDPVIGMGIDVSDIELPNFTTFDTSTIPTPTGTEPRASISAIISSGQSYTDILDTMLTSFRGVLFISEGKIQIKSLYQHAGAGTQIGDDDILGSIAIERAGPVRQSYNTVAGSYIEYGVLTPYPPIVDSSLVTLDNAKPRVLTADFPFTPTHTMAQRLSKMALLASRQDLFISITLPITYYFLNVGDNIGLTNDDMGWTSKVFSIIERTVNTDGTINMRCKHEPATTVAFDYDTEYQEQASLGSLESWYEDRVSEPGSRDQNGVTHALALSQDITDTYLVDANNLSYSSKMQFQILTGHASSDADIADLHEDRGVFCTFIYDGFGTSNTAGFLADSKTAFPGYMQARARLIDDRGVKSDWVDITITF